MKYILLMIIGLIWGSQYVLNTLALQDFSAFGLTAWRMSIGVLTLSLMILFIPSARKDKLQLNKRLVTLFVLIGAVEAAIPFWLIGFGQMHVHSSVAAIIMGTIPMLTVLLELTFKKGHRTSVYEVLGMTLAFIGLIVLVNPSAEDFAGAAIGYFAIFMAAFCFAIALILMEKIPKEVSPLHATRFILGVYALPMIVYWMLDSSTKIPTDPKSLAAVVAIGMFSSGIIYILYLKLIRIAGPTFTSLSNYVVPLVGTFLGVWLLSEPFSLNIAISLLLIILGLVIANKKKRVKRQEG